MTSRHAPRDRPSAPLRISPGWRVTLAGTGVNLALGVLYAWSVIAASLRADLGWTATQAQIPYMIACGTFALLMVPAGRLQDRLGPRLMIVASALLVGVGFIGASLFTTVLGLSICFGLLFGAAIGFGYSSTTPAAVKWFGPHQRGLITGLVVSGSGLAAVYAAPVASILIGSHGVPRTLLIFGLAYLPLILLLSLVIRNPPQGYVPPGPQRRVKERAGMLLPAVVPGPEHTWREMLRDPAFYLLWAMLCFGSLAGLMIIGQLASIALDQSAASLGFVLVAVLAVFNAAGRIGGGILFDRFGQTAALVLVFTVQALNFFLFHWYTGMALLVVGTVVAGLCYGACLSIFPATTAKLFGVRNLGLNYGLIFTAWGAGGVFGGLTSGLVRDATGSFLNAFLIAGGLCLAGAVLAMVLASATSKQTATEEHPSKLPTPGPSPC